MVLVIGSHIAAAAALSGAAGAVSRASGAIRAADTLNAALFRLVNIPCGAAQDQYQDHGNNERFHITYRSGHTLP